MALMLSQGSFSTKVVILDLAKFVLYILPFKLKNASCPFIPQNKLVEVQRSFAPSEKSGRTCLTQIEMPTKRWQQIQGQLCHYPQLINKARR